MMPNPTLKNVRRLNNLMLAFLRTVEAPVKPSLYPDNFQINMKVNDEDSSDLVLNNIKEALNPEFLY